MDKSRIIFYSTIFQNLNSNSRLNVTTWKLFDETLEVYNILLFNKKICSYNSTLQWLDLYIYTDTLLNYVG